MLCRRFARETGNDDESWRAPALDWVRLTFTSPETAEFTQCGALRCTTLTSRFPHWSNLDPAWVTPTTVRRRARHARLELRRLALHGQDRKPVHEEELGGFGVQGGLLGALWRFHAPKTQH